VRHDHVAAVILNNETDRIPWNFAFSQLRRRVRNRHRRDKHRQLAAGVGEQAGASPAAVADILMTPHNGHRRAGTFVPPRILLLIVQPDSSLPATDSTGLCEVWLDIRDHKSHYGTSPHAVLLSRQGHSRRGRPC
jgi:hypothetical protein